jgi:tetratricopeptide (TPR) repeat protein
MTGAYKEFQNLLRQGKLQEAVRLAEQEYLQGSERNVFWLTQKAVALNRSSDYKSAYDTAARALNLDSSSPYAVAAAGEALLEMGRFQDAKQHYEEILDHPRLSKRAHRGVLESLARMKEWKEMLRRLDEWRMPEDETLSWRVKALAALKQTGEALDACRKWLKLKPDHPSALWECTELEIEIDGLDSVVKRMGKLARIPSLPTVYREIYASLCRRAGKPDLAMKEYKKLGAAGADSRIQRKEVFIMAKTGRESEAIPMLEELLMRDPGDIYLHSSYGAACGRIGELERAINFYNSLLTRFPEEKTLYGRISRLRRKLEIKQ